jgi:hypothetical protein
MSAPAMHACRMPPELRKPLQAMPPLPAVRAKPIFSLSYSQRFFRLTSLTEKAGNSRQMNPNPAKPLPSNTPDQPAAGKGQPARDAQPQQPQTGRQPDFHDASVQDTLELPRDRDEAQDMTAAAPDPLIQQAAKDLQKGLKDTSKAEETDGAYKKFRDRAA